MHCPNYIEVERSFRGCVHEELSSGFKPLGERNNKPQPGGRLSTPPIQTGPLAKPVLLVGVEAAPEL